METETTKPAKTKTKKGVVMANGKDTKAVATAAPKEISNMNIWGVPKLSSKDIVIPKILAMQAMSKPVLAGEAKFGELRESLSGKVMGNEKEPLEFIPFFRSVEWVVMRKEKNSFQFNRIEPITPQNENMQMGDIEDEDGNEERWYRTTNFLVLLPDEIKDGGAMPYSLSFRSTSAKAGSKITTTMYLKNLKPRECPEWQKTPASTVLELHASKKENDQGTFIVMDIKEKRLSTQEEVTEAFNWAKTAQSGSVKIDHSDLVSTESEDSDDTELSNDY